MPVYKSEDKTRNGRVWYYSVSYVDLYGNQKRYKSKKFKTKKEAELEEAKFRLEIGKESDAPITFEWICERYKAEKKETVKFQSYKHIEVMCGHICNSLGKVQIAKMNRVQYEQFRRYLTDNIESVTYRNKLNSLLKTLIRFANKHYDVRNDIPDKYPTFTDASAPVKEMDFYTLEEFKQYISVVDDLHYYALFCTLYYMGLRIGEANALMFQDVDFEKNTISITKTVNTKYSNKDGYLTSSPKTKSSIRTLPMPQIVSNALKQIYEELSSLGENRSHAFLFGVAKPIPETTLQNMNKRYAEAAGLKKIRIHDFRHSCASLLINNGASITLVAKYLGHSNVEQTLNTYSHMYKSKLDELIDTINSL